MKSTYLLGCLILLITWHHGASFDRCSKDIPRTQVNFPKFPLTYGDLMTKVIPNMQQSRPYYEIYSFDFKDPDIPPAFQLPILRKVAVVWNMNTSSSQPTYTNDYAGYYPNYSGCENGLIEFTHNMVRPKDMWLVEFDVVWPDIERFVGTSFSSCPERYLINWYCSKNNLVTTPRKHMYCRTGVRMSIYSSSGANDVPWHLVVQDICSNGMPKMDDPRWTMTYDAPEHCNVTHPELTFRKKRSSEGHSRHYL